MTGYVTPARPAKDPAAITHRKKNLAFRSGRDGQPPCIPLR